MASFRRRLHALGRLSAILILFATLAPSAAAGSAAPVSGVLQSAPALELEGPLAVEARDAVLDLTAAVEAGRALEIRFEAAEGVLASVRERSPGNLFPVHERPSVERLRWGSATIANLSCEAACTVLVFARAGGRIAAEAPSGGPLEWTQERRSYCGAFCGGSTLYQRLFPPGALTFTAPEAVTLSGDVGLFLENATAEVWVDGRRHLVDATFERGAGAGADALVMPTAHARYAVLNLTAPLLSGEGAEEGLLVAEAARLRTEKGARAPAATGWVDYLGKRHRFEGERLVIEGELAFDADVRGVILPPPAPERGAAAGPFSGEASRVVLGARALAPAEARDGPSTLAASAGVLSLAAILLLLAPRALLPLYSRITRSSVLANPTRKALFDMLQRQPGLTMADVARAGALPRVVAQHHVRMLEAHGMVVARKAGATRRYYVSGAAPDGGTVERQHVVADATRAEVARAVLASPGVTQREISERTGVSLRLVSYHLQRLEALGLVVAEGRLPRRFTPAPALVALPPAEAVVEARASAS